MATAEVLCIGTELLLGDVLDTNSQFLAQQLALLGINCFHRVTVGDNPERIRECMRTALLRADILITSGGIGPTADDLTTESIAQVFGAPLDVDQEVLAFIEGLFAARGLKMPPSNAKQALRPRGARILPNPVGSAPGIIWTLGPAELAVLGLQDVPTVKSILTFPGVPSELKGMWAGTARGYLEETYAGGTIWSKELKHYGIGESALAEKFAHLLDLANPSVAPYAGNWECRLRVAAKAATLEEARALAQPVIDEIKQGSGVRCYGEDSDTLESVVGRLLTERGLIIALAESCTGGMVSERLTNIPGSSRYIMLNAVTYSNEAKHRVLGVSEEILNTQGAVSPECARAMALGIRQLTSCDLGLSVTGIAGPDGGTEEKPIGLVYLGLSARGADNEERYFARTLRLGKRLGRHEVRWRTAQEALNMVRLYLIDPQHLESP
ncbi:MAG: competence/damage-inducible protein A [Cyanobacteria bacterium SZAS TMP-1]|nr:competence/damage-inducible protein A [Cyanobacteria bacterium SZAS TMP-1]